MAFLLKAVIASNLLVLKFFMFASFNALLYDKYCSWYKMWRPVLRHLSSILDSFLVIMGPQKATLPSQIDKICCFNTSINSGIGQPRDFSLLKTHILLYAFLHINSVLVIVFISERIIWPRIFCSSSSST